MNELVVTNTFNAVVLLLYVTVANPDQLTVFVWLAVLKITIDLFAEEIFAPATNAVDASVPDGVLLNVDVAPEILLAKDESEETSRNEPI